MNRILITTGDAAGIGPEITVKALQNKEIYDKCIPVVIGDYEALKDAVLITGSPLKLKKIDDPSEAVGEYGTIELVDLGMLEPKGWKYKTVSGVTGEAAFQYLTKAIAYSMSGISPAIVTGPINKEAINLAGHHYSGHTEILGEYTGSKSYAMLLMSGNLRVIHVTTHVSMREACNRITKENVLKKIILADESMRLLGFEVPRIGVAGLNAHSSENGLFGTEEEKEITPAIIEAQKLGILCEGPVPPDSVFVKAMGGMYDIVVAMYHDQGHIPIKIAGFKLDPQTQKYVSMSGVNCTVGLPIIRTSVDHGTAFGKAGEGRANEGSMIEAILTAITMAENKK